MNPRVDAPMKTISLRHAMLMFLFIFLLGHDIDFGHMEAVNLLSSNKYSEKQIVSFVGSKSCVVYIPQYFFENNCG